MSKNNTMSIIVSYRDGSEETFQGMINLTSVALEITQMEETQQSLIKTVAQNRTIVGIPLDLVKRYTIS